MFCNWFRAWLLFSNNEIKLIYTAKKAKIGKWEFNKTKLKPSWCYQHEQHTYLLNEMQSNPLPLTKKRSALI